MSKKEIIAYAITHAPPGVKGGPYEAKGGGYGDPATLREAAVWRGERGRGPDEEDLELARMTLADVRKVHPDARVVGIVRAQPSPSEASAVEVLRELVATWDRIASSTPMSRFGDAFALTRAASGTAEEAFGESFARARAVLAASGPDPMPVVRAAMAWADSRDRGQECSALYRAVETYRKAGGK